MKPTVKLTLLFLALLPLGADEAESYFPPDEKVSSRASEILKLVDEPKLSSFEASKDLECLRFTYIPTFGNPYIIRLTKRENVIHLKSAILNGLGGYELGRTSEVREENRTKSYLAEEILIRAEKCFRAEERLEEGSGLDGSRWILEFLDEDGYRVADLWTPTYNDENKDFVFLCNLLVEFSGLTISHREDIGLLDPLKENEFEKLKESFIYRIANPENEKSSNGPIDPFADPKNQKVEPGETGQSH
jgi:hypothetical protein